jgi:cell division protein FtsQ
MIKRILYILLWVVLVSGLLVTLGFVSKQQAVLRCSEMNIAINRTEDLYFIDEDDIRHMIWDKGDSVIHEPLASINISKIERLLETNPWVANAEVYMSIDGKLQIDIQQREPIVRIINAKGDSFYIDTEGKLMLWSEKFTPRVLVASGEIPDNYITWHKKSVAKIEQSDSLKQRTLIDDIYNLSKYVAADSLWNAQVEQLYYNTNGDMELVPKVGNHHIIFGDVTDMDEKFKNLKLFYIHGLNHVGWNQYDTINLKFKNQVVCTKIK